MMTEFKRTGEEETACGSDNYPADTRAKNQGT